MEVNEPMLKTLPMLTLSFVGRVAKHMAVSDRR
jgi:hypothetical protein